jgi:hypothetical protein
MARLTIRSRSLVVRPSAGIPITMPPERTPQTGANPRVSSTSWGHWFVPSTAHLTSGPRIVGFSFLADAASSDAKNLWKRERQ